MAMYFKTKQKFTKRLKPNKKYFHNYQKLAIVLY